MLRFHVLKIAGGAFNPNEHPRTCSPTFPVSSGSLRFTLAMLKTHLLCYLSLLPFLFAQNSSSHESPSASVLSSSQSISSSLLVSTTPVSTSVSSVPTQSVISPSVSSGFTPFPVPSDIPEAAYPGTDPSNPPAVSCHFLSTIAAYVHKILSSRLTLVFFQTLGLHGPQHGKRLNLRYETSLRFPALDGIQAKGAR